MKNIIPTLGIVFWANVMFAVNPSDSIHTCFSKIQATDATIQTLQGENEVLKSEVTTLKSILAVQSTEIDSLKLVITETNISVGVITDSINNNISTTREQIQTNTDSLHTTIAKKTQTGMWIFIALTIVLAVISFVFGNLIAKRDNEIASLSARADKLNEDIVNRLSSEIAEILAISKQIDSITTTPGGGTDTEQKLISTLADRITFMEMTLYKMDSSVRGHKQLSKSIKQMKDNLLANGYELVDMLGKDYHDGMKVTANFVEDENLPDGKQIITGIIKPQINYQGKMIQSAQITVSQNL